jgi:hypothetical protein
LGGTLVTLVANEDNVNFWTYMSLIIALFLNFVGLPYHLEYGRRDYHHYTLYVYIVDRG